MLKKALTFNSFEDLKAYVMNQLNYGLKGC